jgi:hypothetical protein
MSGDERTQLGAAHIQILCLGVHAFGV